MTRVTGGTGGIGGEVLRLLSQAGIPAREPFGHQTIGPPSPCRPGPENSRRCCRASVGASAPVGLERYVPECLAVSRPTGRRPESCGGGASRSSKKSSPDRAVDVAAWTAIMQADATG